MISSRRLAREWALKILYQMDVGKVPMADAAESALERLRLEFVQRGSRTASGSTAEQICLDYVTKSLTETLSTSRLAFERTIALNIARALSGAPYWQEGLFERSFKNKFKGKKLQPAYLTSPASHVPILNSKDESVDDADSVELTPHEITRITRFMSDISDNLPRIVEPEMSRTGRKQVAVANAVHIESGYIWDVTADSELMNMRLRFNDTSEQRWAGVADTVQKQVADWMRVAGFTVRIIDSMQLYQAEIDQVLSDLSSGWKLERQVAVDRNILRLAALEMLHIPEIPTSASINEAVELAKKYSTTESGRFVNGVLGGLAAKINKPAADENTESEPDTQGGADNGDDLVYIDDDMDLAELTDSDDLPELPLEIDSEGDEEE